MDIKSNWTKIKRHFTKAFQSSLHFSIASVDNENKPTVTPIGSLFLNDDGTGFYFEKYPTKLPRHAKLNKSVCVLAVNSGWLFWLKALFKSKFDKYPAVKLYGELGIKRVATPKEIQKLNRRMRMTKGLKGHEYLWVGDMTMVREIYFDKAEKINLGKMTQHL